MKQLVLLAALFLCVASSMKAQTVFEENFNDSNFNNWILALSNGENISLGVIESFPQMADIGFTSIAMSATTFNEMAEHIDGVDVSIVTPAIVLPSVESNLSFRIGSLSIGQGSAHYSLYVITAIDMQNINTASQLSAMINNKIPENSATVSGNSSVVTLSLEQYAGQTIRVAWRLHDTTSNILFLLDDVVIMHNALGTNTIATVPFLVYPNPATNTLYIEGHSSQLLDSVLFTDLNGRDVLTKRFRGLSNAQVDVSGLSSGMYVVTIVSESGKTIKKFMKQ